MSFAEPQSADIYPVWESYLSPVWFPAVMTADEFGLFRALEETPASIGDLAVMLSLNARALGALLDMFRSEWPTGYDVHFFSNPFHDWRPELAHRSFSALESGGSINLHEMLIADDGSGPRLAASFAVLMVAGTQGCQYSFAQLREILGTAGFVDVEVRRTTPTHSLA